MAFDYPQKKWLTIKALRRLPNEVLAVANCHPDSEIKSKVDFYGETISNLRNILTDTCAYLDNSKLIDKEIKIETIKKTAKELNGIIISDKDIEKRKKRNNDRADKNALILLSVFCGVFIGYATTAMAQTLFSKNDVRDNFGINKTTFNLMTFVISSAFFASVGGCIASRAVKTKNEEFDVAVKKWEKENKGGLYRQLIRVEPRFLAK